MSKMTFLACLHVPCVSLEVHLGGGQHYAISSCVHDACVHEKLYGTRYTHQLHANLIAPSVNNLGI